MLRLISPLLLLASTQGWASGVRSTGVHAEVVLGHPFYPLWYTALESSGNGYPLGHAIGTDWEPRPDNPLPSGGFAHEPEPGDGSE